MIRNEKIHQTLEGQIKKRYFKLLDYWSDKKYPYYKIIGGDYSVNFIMEVLPDGDLKTLLFCEQNGSGGMLSQYFTLFYNGDTEKYFPLKPVIIAEIERQIQWIDRILKGKAKLTKGFVPKCDSVVADMKRALSRNEYKANVDRLTPREPYEWEL